MRLVQDSVTIIILGNKYNRNIYQAKKLANIFSNYFENDEEDKSEDTKENDLNVEKDHIILPGKSHHRRR